MRPSLGCSKPATIRSVVVLPQPEGPSSEKNSPGSISRSRPLTATVLAEALRDLLEANCAHAVSRPTSTPSPLSRRPSRRGSAMASPISTAETASMSVPIALIVGVTPKRIAE